MSFFETLQQQTADARQHVFSAPVIAAVAAGRFDLEGYVFFLTQAFHHVRHTVPLMMACGARLRHDQEAIRAALVEYIDDEYGHDEWILNDLRACGADADAIRDGKPCLPIELMVAFLYDRIARGNPLAFFGMVHVLEGTSIQLAHAVGQRVQSTLGLPKTAFSYLYSHGQLDQAHYEFFKTLMDGITDPNDQAAIIHSANVVFRLYGDMLRSIPVPEALHEAA